MSGKYRDIPVKTIGPIEKLPFISSSPLHGTKNPGYGAIYYKCRNVPLHYAIVHIRGVWDDEMFLVCKQSEAARVIIACKRQCEAVFDENKPPILADGILEDIVANTVGFLIKSKEIERYGIRIKRGLILEGEPGNGKSMVCRYLQRLCIKHSINFGIVTAAHIDKAYRDQQLTKLFHQYMVTFFDDIDITYMNRKSGDGKVATSLLTAMDGMFNDSHLIRIFTTNERVNDLDPAFTRPGRIDKCITLSKPDEKLRRRLVETWPKEIKDNLDLDKLIKLSTNFSFAEMESIHTLLVTNKILGNGKWDLERAFREHNERSKNDNRKLGFVINR
jgi:AAA+ superfamily predicted ATPase